MEPQTKNCQKCHKDFIIEPEDFSFYEKIKVPLPTFCWPCRAQRRMSWRNENCLFKRTSDFSGKDIFSAFSPLSPVKVYEKDVWLSDKWDAMDYGRDYNFSRSFFDQFRDLLQIVPLKSLNVVNAVNSDYSNNMTDPRNCYLCFNGKGAEDCMYSNGLSFLKDCVDISNCRKSEKCYESFWLTSCSNVIFSSQCDNSFNLSFCRDCAGCHDCFGCVGLRNQEFNVFNVKYTKEEYQEKVKEFNISSYQSLQELINTTRKFWKTFPKKYVEGNQNTNVSGNYISHSKNTSHSFLIREGENLKYCQYMQELPGSKDSYDYTAWGDSVQMAYECTSCGIGVNNIKFCSYVQESVHDIEYSYACSGSSYLFGCVGLKKKQYCIFNKQYTKEEYEILVGKIKKHMDDMPYIDNNGVRYRYGEFFPNELSPFAYNETLAIEYFPLTKDEAEGKGFLWRDVIEKNYIPTIKAQDLPDNIKDIKEDITSEIIECLHNGNCNDQCTKAFRIIPDELQFYRKMNLPLPRLCPKCRTANRLKQRTHLDVIERKCECNGSESINGSHKNVTTHLHGDNPCGEKFLTSYTDESDLLYCEKCYQQEVH